ncbi:MAG: rod shape-determining protein RodA [Candidatus Latescibacter sp.]|nr:rod shape-determining protein RodA [Candidatus Latescibacter sp.]
MSKILDRSLDRGLAIAVLLILLIGVVMIHSASRGENVESSLIWIKQIAWALISIGIMAVIIHIPVKYIYAFAYIFYVLMFFCLILVDLFGSSAGGSERWLKFGPLRFQPSEFMKVAVILALARYMSFKKNKPTTYVKCLIPALLILFPMGMVLLQPDLGTSMVFCALIFPMLYWAGLDSLRLFFLLAPILSAIFAAPFIPWFNWVTWVIFMFFLLGVLYYTRQTLTGMGLVISANILAGIATPIAFNCLKPYQQERITTFIKPEADPLGAGYQIIHSKVAIGSGGIIGKGIGNGKYTELGFLPRSHTDFIFAVIGEELGFIGAVIIIGIISYIAYRGIRIASSIRNPFMSLAAIGISTVFIFHVYVNVGMAIGIMPVTGIPLPFLSYGGSSCLSNAVMVGLLLNFSVNRHEF